MKDFERYGIKVGQLYKQNRQSRDYVRVVDVKTFADVGEVIITDRIKVQRIKIDKLADMIPVR